MWDDLAGTSPPQPPHPRSLLLSLSLSIFLPLLFSLCPFLFHSLMIGKGEERKRERGREDRKERIMFWR
jgi:hypothetical protein